MIIVTSETGTRRPAQAPKTSTDNNAVILHTISIDVRHEEGEGQDVENNGDSNEPLEPA